MIRSTAFPFGQHCLELIVENDGLVTLVTPTPRVTSTTSEALIRALRETANWLESVERDRADAAAYHALYFLDDRSSTW